MSGRPSTPWVSLAWLAAVLSFSWPFLLHFFGLVFDTSLAYPKPRKSCSHLGAVQFFKKSPCRKKLWKIVAFLIRPPRRPQDLPRTPLDPQRPQRLPKDPPKTPQRPSKTPKPPKDPPKDPQRPPKTPKDPPQTLRDMIFKGFSKMFKDFIRFLSIYKHYKQIKDFISFFRQDFRRFLNTRPPNSIR